jgi:hypothetical protein
VKKIKPFAERSYKGSKEERKRWENQSISILIIEDII